METGQHIFMKLLETIYDFEKEACEQRQVARLTSAELVEWRS